MALVYTLHHHSGISRHTKTDHCFACSTSTNLLLIPCPGFPVVEKEAKPSIITTNNSQRSTSTPKPSTRARTPSLTHRSSQGTFLLITAALVKWDTTHHFTITITSLSSGSSYCAWPFLSSLFSPEWMSFLTKKKLCIFFPDIGTKELDLLRTK